MTIEEFNITKEYLRNFELQLFELEQLTNWTMGDRILVDAIKGQIETFKQEITEYENQCKQRELILFALDTLADIFEDGLGNIDINESAGDLRESYILKRKELNDKLININNNDGTRIQ